MSSSNSDFNVALMVGIGFGVYAFFRGFRIYREYRVLADTPEAPIRSIAMGLVEIHGKAKGDKTVNSPVTNTPCFFYKVDIEEYKADSRGNRRWQHAATDTNGLPFYLEDASGKVLVSAFGAELDLMQSGKRETGSGIWSGLRGVLGNDQSEALSPALQVPDGQLISYAQTVIAERGHGLLSRNLIGNLARPLFSMGIGERGSNTGRYRFKEYCILPEHWYDVTGTCAENAAPKDDNDRNIILKGENDPIFLISWRSERGIESRLRKRASLHVFGGATLSVACLAILLSRLGWL